MKRFALILIIIFALGTGLAWAASEPDDWGNISGIYVGHAEVKNPEGQVIPTEVRIQIRKSKTKYYVVEMFYMNNKVAKFSKCARVAKNKLNIFDKIKQGNTYIEVEGNLKSDDWKILQGTVKFKKGDQFGQLLPFRTFKLIDLKKNTL